MKRYLHMELVIQQPERELGCWDNMALLGSLDITVFVF